MELTFRDQKGAPLTSAEGDANVRALANVGLTTAPPLVYVAAEGSDTTGALGSSVLKFKTIAAAIAALPASGGVVHIGPGDFVSPPTTALKNNLFILGSGKPTFDTYRTLAGTFTAAPTKLVSGTVLKGTFDGTQYDIIKVRDLGVDCGSAWCTASNGGQPANALVFAQYYGGNVSSDDGTHGRQTDFRPRYGVEVHNVTTLCQNATAAVHAALFENLIDPVIENVTTAFGQHGVVFKTIGGIARGIQAFGHGNNGLIAKSNFYAYNRNLQISEVYVGSVATNDGGGIRVSSPEANADYSMKSCTISNFKVVGTSYGVTQEGPLLTGIVLTNGEISYCNGDGLALTNVDTSLVSGIAVHHCNGTGFKVTGGRLSKLRDCSAIDNAGLGFILDATGANRLDVRGLTAVGNPGGSISYTAKVHTWGEIIVDADPTGASVPETGTVNIGGGTTPTPGADTFTYPNTASTTAAARDIPIFDVTSASTTYANGTATCVASNAGGFENSGVNTQHLWVPGQEVRLGITHHGAANYNCVIAFNEGTTLTNHPNNVASFLIADGDVIGVGSGTNNIDSGLKATVSRRYEVCITAAGVMTLQTTTNGTNWTAIIKWDRVFTKPLSAHFSLLNSSKTLTDLVSLGLS